MLLYHIKINLDHLGGGREAREEELDYVGVCWAVPRPGEATVGPQ
jgi:hypothetical protein